MDSSVWWIYNTFSLLLKSYVIYLLQNLIIVQFYYHMSESTQTREKNWALDMFLSWWWSNQNPAVFESSFCFTQSPAHTKLPQIKAHMSSHMMLMPRKNPDLCFACKCPQAKRGRKMFICTTHRLPHPRPRVCAWIAASWRWTWSIRSINRDYCNPRGQREGTGPLRVHTSHTSSRQICAGMANMRPPWFYVKIQTFYRQFNHHEIVGEQLPAGFCLITTNACIYDFPGHEMRQQYCKCFICF